MDIANAREILNGILLEPDPSEGLWELYNSGWADRFLPEFSALRLEQHPTHRHKDVLAHTIIVTARAKVDIKLRLAALFHDIGKPATRKFSAAGVTFRHHEAVGAKIAKKRLRALGYEDEMVRDVSELVRLSGRFKGYSDGWTDAAVRRYVKDSGSLLQQLNDLVRSDCTTRNKAKEQNLQRLVTELESRIVTLKEEEKKAAERPQLDGSQIMEILQISGGPAVGKAVRFLLEMKRERGVLSEQEIRQELLRWWESQPS